MTDWISRWESKRIGWHAEQVNRHLNKYLEEWNRLKAKNEVN